MRLELQTGNQRQPVLREFYSGPTNYATHERIGHKNDLTKSAKVGEHVKTTKEKGSAVQVTATHVFEQKLCCGRVPRRHNNN